MFDLKLQNLTLGHSFAVIFSMTVPTDALIAEVDTWIGEIMREIDEAGMSECTMTVFTADHGTSHFVFF